MRKKPKPAAVALLLVIAAAIYVAQNWKQWTGTRPDNRIETRAGDSPIEEAIRARRSGVVVETEGTVARLLPDDRSGDRHQRFLLRLLSGHTVLVAHNIDLAPKVPLRANDRLRLRGQYEWNAKGGVLHWTHHDPGGRRQGGWIELRGKRYR